MSQALLTTRRNDFLRSLVEHTLTFALGRGVEPYDQPAVDKIIAEMNANDSKFSSLVSGVVHSVPFQMRRGSSTNSPSPGNPGEGRGEGSGK